MENATSSRKDVKVNAYRGEYNCTYSGLCNYAMVDVTNLDLLR